MNGLPLGRYTMLAVCCLFGAWALLGAPGCSEPKGAVIGSEEATQLPPIKVELPPPPSFVEAQLPVTYPDGTVSVFGLHKEKDKFLGKEVKVAAFLLDIYQCPVCPKGQTCKLCDQPHFFLADSATDKREKALMVVDYLMPKQKPPAMTVGKQYIVEGTFSRNSPSGFADSEGLLQFTSLVDDKGIKFMSPASLLEAKAIAGEALEAARLLKEKAEPAGKSAPKKHSGPKAEIKGETY